MKIGLYFLFDDTVENIYFKDDGNTARTDILAVIGC